MSNSDIFSQTEKVQKKDRTEKRKLSSEELDTRKQKKTTKANISQHTDKYGRNAYRTGGNRKKIEGEFYKKYHESSSDGESEFFEEAISEQSELGNDYGMMDTDDKELEKQDQNNQTRNDQLLQLESPKEGNDGWMVQSHRLKRASPRSPIFPTPSVTYIQNKFGVLDEDEGTQDKNPERKPKTKTKKEKEKIDDIGKPNQRQETTTKIEITSETDAEKSRKDGNYEISKITQKEIEKRNEIETKENDSENKVKDTEQTTNLPETDEPNIKTREGPSPNPEIGIDPAQNGGSI